MARTIAGELTLPDGSPLANAAIHFTAKRTEAVRILEDVSSFFTTSSTGAYSQDVESGYYAVSISYAAVPGTQPRRWHLGDVWVEDGDPISLTALLALNNSAADPTDSALRQLLADAQAARDEAQAAAQEAEQYRDETASMLDSKIDESEKGEPGGVATLDSGGRVPAGQLPSYVDDVEEYADYAALPTPGEAGKIYITIDNNRQYRWGGSEYIELVASPGTTDNVPEGSSNLYHTAARVRAVALAGISFASSAAITASDTILSAFGKIQGKLNTLKGMAFLDKATFEQAIDAESDEAGMTPRRTRQLLESRAVGLSEGVIAIKEPGTPSRGNAFSIGDGGGTSGWFKVCQIDTTGLSNVDNAFSLTVLGRRVSFDLDFHLRTGSDGASPTMPFFRITKANRGNVGEEVCIVQVDNIFTLYVHYRISGWENAAVFVKSVSDRLGLFSQRTTWFTGVREDPVDGVFPEVVGPVLESASPELRVGEGKVTPESIDNWNTAYGWGDHASAGYYSPDNVGTPGKNLLAASTQEAAREAIGFDSVSPATPANGGLLVDNQKTGTGLERVLTESDLGGGGEDARYVSVAALGATGGDHVADQAAFENAMLDGRPVFIPPPPSASPYVVANVLIPAGRKVFGVGPDSKILLAPGDYGDTDQTPAAALVAEDAPGVHIFDLYVDGNKSNVTGTNLYNIEGINIRRSDDTIVERVTTVNTMSDGIDFDDTKNGKAIDCIGINCGGNAVHHSEGAVNPVTERCYAYNCGYDRDRGAFDIFYFNTVAGKIIDCTAESCNSGISANSTSGGAIVTGNHVISCDGRSIEVRNYSGQGQASSGNGSTVSNNRITDAKGDGIVIESNNCGVIGNVVTGGSGGGTGSGIRVTGSKTRVIGNDARYFNGGNFSDEGTGTIDLGNNFTN